MSSRRLNVLVYTGTGTSVESVRQCIYSLRCLVSDTYAVAPVSETTLLKEPWAATCALLVIPGGADLGYCRVLNGAGNRLISDYVRRGGAYLGFCAGAYYASRRCEFEVGNGELEVIGSRELALFPGICRGAAFSGFEYGSERGARACQLAVHGGVFGSQQGLPDSFASYFNGGGVFVDAASVTSRKVQILASYHDAIRVDGGDGKAAIVLCHVGEGKVLLTGPHPEFAAANLSPQPSVPGYDRLIQELEADDKARVSFLKACLCKLGLEVGLDEAPVATLSSIHVSSPDPTRVTRLIDAWHLIADNKDDQFFIRGESDTFLIETQQACSGGMPLDRAQGIVDYASITKHIIPHQETLPPSILTPRLNHQLYFSSLERFHAEKNNASRWGSLFMYGEVVTSTNSLLEKNPTFMSTLPTGFVFSASTQISARGRGNNAWVAPRGALMFSTIISHPARLAASRPIVFTQYVAAIAIIEAIQSLGVGYQELPVKLKWPNDIYALDPTSHSERYVKVGGILSQCCYFDGSYQIVLGIGINANNPRPTTSLSSLAPPHAAPLRLEVLLARLLASLEAVYSQFLREGFSADLEHRYYRHWLHTGQLVQLEAEGGARARVLGITSDWGMLRVEQTDQDGRGTGKIWTLQSDENSFDFWKGLVRRKQ
ncbi:hypothetical protein CDD81_6973 [Ophiocordyceps australis]|uniref:BPL/LPL catalytic domain-containing protein n=1 Tax=Ophiocordyceps australis TaxID=1399860 RepID=A0A2C5XLM7_9HYPO|nr:hypothetical protein CDD81_6973 [Ophiocordyceps australis]